MEDCCGGGVAEAGPVCLVQHVRLTTGATLRKRERSGTRAARDLSRSAISYTIISWARWVMPVMPDLAGRSVAAASSRGAAVVQTVIGGDRAMRLSSLIGWLAPSPMVWGEGTAWGSSPLLHTKTPSSHSKQITCPE